MIQEMTDQILGARLLSIAGTIQDSQQAEREILSVEAEAKRLNIYRELKLSIWSSLAGH
jgi:hypothetical protein